MYIIALGERTEKTKSRKQVKKVKKRRRTTAPPQPEKKNVDLLMCYVGLC